jgi:hypothetical protein
MWKKHGTAGQATDTAHALCMMNKYRYTHLEYVIHVAFPLQQPLKEVHIYQHMHITEVINIRLPFNSVMRICWYT